MDKKGERKNKSFYSSVSVDFCPKIRYVISNIMDRKQQFLKIYSSLPLGIRKEIIAVLDEPVGPVTWEVAYIEIENDTSLGQQILDKLVNLEII